MIAHSFFSTLRELYLGFRVYRQFGGGLLDFLLIVFGIERIAFLTDCFDTQTQMRIVPTRVKFDVEPVEPFRAGQIQIGFSLLGLVLTRMRYDVAHLPLQIVFGNAAPRYGHSAPGEAVDMVLAFLPKARLLYLGTGGECLSLVRNFIDWERSYLLKLTDEPTDYRSAFIPRTLERILRGDLSPCISPLVLERVPEANSELIVLALDSFGNIMVGGRVQGLPEIGTPVEITLGGVTLDGHIGKNLGDAEEGEIVVSPGSTSRLLEGADYKVFYIYRLQGSAALTFEESGHRIKPGDPVLLNKKRELPVVVAQECC